MGQILGLPEVLETDDEDVNHLGLDRPLRCCGLSVISLYREMVLSVLRYNYHFAVL